MAESLWLILVVGVLIGIYIGRRWAEYRRARYDMNRVWNTRRNYRQ